MPPLDAPSLDASFQAYPPLNLRPREAARLAEQPCPPIAAGAHPDQWPRPYGQAISGGDVPNPLTPHRR